MSKYKKDLALINYKAYQPQPPSIFLLFPYWFILDLLIILTNPGWSVGAQIRWLLVQGVEGAQRRGQFRWLMVPGAGSGQVAHGPGKGSGGLWSPPNPPMNRITHILPSLILHTWSIMSKYFHTKTSGSSKFSEATHMKLHCRLLLDQDPSAFQHYKVTASQCC